MNPRSSFQILVGAAALFGLSIASAQTRSAAAAPALKNLKIFPKTTSRAALVANMKLMSQSLGVRCTYCHVGEEGKPPSTFDFASDANPNKAIARDMMRLVQRLNRKDLPAIGGLLDPHVTCYSCHRGFKTPATEPPPLKQ